MTRCAIDVEVDAERLRASDQSAVLGDATLLRRATGWEPRVALEQSLGEILAAHRSA